MAPLDSREQKNASILYAGISFSIIAWWITLIFVPQSRIHFLGESFSEKFFWVLIVPDLISAIALPTLLIPAILKNRPNASTIAWLHAGGQGYAFLISIALAIIDPRAYWGVVGMMLSTGIAFFLALRIQNIDILWGKFRFKPAPSSTPKAHLKRAITQTINMWIIFLGIIPLIIAQSEIFLDFNQNWFHFPGQIPVAATLFVLLGSFGIWGTSEMTKYGDGTPLPSEHTNKLVTTGPYRFIRNPMALCGTTQGIVVGLGIGSPFVMSYGLLGAFAWNILVRPAEEAQLASSFGEEFETYKTKINCWIPRLNRKNHQAN